MTILNNQRVIAIEEHYYDPEVSSYFQGSDTRTGGFVREQLEEVGAARCRLRPAWHHRVPGYLHGRRDT
jgi:hypothetical protein